ncbi:ATP-dependent DNA helicase RecG [Cellulomonas sp. ACRRI]|uniref:ATP-dependent DNA helicase RecG n=1 Tax=Cellulomonas sp. ACRRI TaxID=2918188 RepID=UPI0027DF6F77|nr:ATP-dependent DNA helicase RecG [Cellulomonas sp. ACRRI]
MTVPHDAVVRPLPYLDQDLAKHVPGAAKKLAKLGLHTVGDLLRYYPRRYSRWGDPATIGHLRVGEHVTVDGTVDRSTTRTMRSRGGVILEVVVRNGRQTLLLTWFAKHPGALRHFEQQLKPGTTGLFSGTVKEYRGQLQLLHPEFEIDDPMSFEDEAQRLVESQRPRPVYGLTAGLKNEAVVAALETVRRTLTAEDLPDPLPDEVRGAMPGILDALQGVHHPLDDTERRRAQDRLRFEEAFVLQAELARRKARYAAQAAVARPARAGGLLDAFDARLPFELTGGQREIGAQIAAELAADSPMQRLLQGEVGSGKTVVAARAMLQVVDAGGQAALLAPTEVLAAQHARTLQALLGDLAEAGMLGGAEVATRVALLTGSQGSAARRRTLGEIAGGAAGIVVGTHALLSEHVQFADLGLVVVDEQHRFGVEQRDVLRAKAGGVPHLLVMTATPIPRTVAMTVFGDLETSTLREVPRGRAEVVTHVVPADKPAWLERTWQRIREEVDRGGRAYVVCARIDADAKKTDVDGADLVTDVPEEDGDARPQRPLHAVVEVAEQLRGTAALRGLAVGELHGRMGPEEKDRALADFASGAVPVLVSTTVIEVGVDVPDATVMVVLDADRFGISQLHQLRGRIGRGSRPGVCLLVAEAPPGTDAATRLGKLAETRDGFELAAVDLALRREGDVLGAAQSGGSSSLRLLQVTEHADVIERARVAARELVDADPDLAAHPALAEAIRQMLAGEREEFLDRT